MASLHIAVLFGDEELTRSLLEEGYDVNTYDTRLGTPLSIAVFKGYRSIVRLLDEHGADHNSEQFTTALIHSGLDELKLPDLPPISDRVQQNASEPAEVQVQSPASLHDDTNARDDSLGQQEFENASTDYGGVPLWTNGVIRTWYMRDGKPEDIPPGPGTWSNRHPAADDQDNFSIVRIMDHNDESELYTRQIQIRGPKLCSFISRVLEGYPGTSNDPSKIILQTTTDEIIDAEFIGLFHRSENYIRLYEEEIDVATKAQAELLLECLKPLWQLISDLVERCRITGFIKHGHLWSVFRPEEVIIVESQSRDTNELFAAKLKQVILVTRPWGVNDLELIVEVVNWNGSSTGYEARSYTIEYYTGHERMNSGIYPISFDSDPDAIRKKLVERGRKFESLRGFSFMTRKAFNISRRVIIDNYAYYRFEECHFPQYVELDGQSRRGKADDAYDSDEMLPPAIGLGGFQSTSVHLDANSRALTDEECLLCAPKMYGFDIQEKEWNEVEVEDLESVIWNNEAFTHLTMQEDQKRLILAFTKQKQMEEIRFDDFIAGKGKSLIILLCGPPGVGKTLTAESVAERSRAPLYMLSAGDLGTDASSVESSLKKALDLCSHWKAVMLIDEADVFLEARKTDNLKRNELVSVFLRMLEYYNGILFLTTNRAATIDTAFESRIDLIIPYEDLDAAARRQVWSNFVKKLVAATHELCDADFDELSRRKLNGREIKSAVKTALMLATGEGQTLQLQHINVVMDIRQRASDYLHGKA